MQLVPLRSLGKLERLSCCNWCKHHLGPEDPGSWFLVETSNDGPDNILLTRAFKDAGVTHSIVFNNDMDAVAFKLRFGL
jgi:hypothetical protein